LIYAFYDLRSGNGVGPVVTAPEPTRANIKSKADHPCVCISYDLELDPVTSILDLDLDIVKMYPRI